MRWYLGHDLGAVRATAGRWSETHSGTTLPGNWKTAADNFAGDDYHTFYLHRSTIETGIIGGVQFGDISENLDGFHIQAGNGHNFIRFMMPARRSRPPLLRIPGERDQALRSRHARARAVRRGQQHGRLRWDGVPKSRLRRLPLSTIVRRDRWPPSASISGSPEALAR